MNHKVIKQQNLRLRVSSSPQISHSMNSKKIMWTVSAVLMPAALWGVFVFGFESFMVLFSTIVSCLCGEYIVNIIIKRNTIHDGSAFLTGLLLGMNMPPQIPLYIPIVSSFFAIWVVKWTFGGLGKNWANPAIAGRVFAFLSWSKPMMKWKMALFPWQRNFFTNKILDTHSFFASSSSYDSLTGATPLGMLKEGAASLSDLTSDGTIINGPLDLVSAMQNMTNGYHISTIDKDFSAWVSKALSINIKPGLFDSFFGLIPGSIGEISLFLLLVGAIILFIKKIISWEIPITFLGSFALLVWIFGGFRYGNGFFHGDAFYQIFTGGIILGAFFMATDMVSSPLTRPGMIIFGMGCGLLTFLVRFLGNFPEGVSLSILFMNIWVPLLDRYIEPRKFGSPKAQFFRNLILTLGNRGSR